MYLICQRKTRTFSWSVCTSLRTLTSADMGQVCLQSFLVQPGCPFGCSTSSSGDPGNSGKGWVFPGALAWLCLGSCHSTRVDFSSKWERWERLGWILILKYWAELMFFSQKSCRDLLMSNSSLPVPCRAQRLTTAGCVRIMFRLKISKNWETWVHFFHLCCRFRFDFEYDNFFCILILFSMTDGRKYFFLSMSIFQRMKCSCYFKMHLDVIEALITAGTLTATVLLLKNWNLPFNRFIPT